MSLPFADLIDMQNRLFAELSRMFGQEVPLYDKSLLVNRECNRTVCDLLGRVHVGFGISDQQLETSSGERHGAIRIGTPSEYRWVARFFGAFAMEPHNFYDMTNVGAKSQPVVATAFRSRTDPGHRVFTSLLLTEYFDPQTRARIEGLLAGREIFSDRARALIEKSERQGALDWADAEALIREGTQRIFKWTGRARDHQLYRDLCDRGFKIAADIACFESHHLNHLTPNTFCIDLYTAAMKLCMGELAEAQFRRRALAALGRMVEAADRDALRLQFKHLSWEQIESFRRVEPPPGTVETLVEGLAGRLRRPELDLRTLEHSGFKDSTEGPAEDTPVLLRQDAYKALTEPVRFTNADGSTIDTVHTARFGEIEQRSYATTAAGRELYDHCLAAAEAEKERDPGLAKRDFGAYEAMYARHFAPFPKTLAALAEQGLVYARYTPTADGLAAAGTIDTTDIHELVRRGLVRREGLRYEDFLPVSAAGIFASNLNQYGTRSTAAQRPVYTQAMLEEVMGKPIIDAERVYRAQQAESMLETYRRLGLVERLAPAERAQLEAAAEALPSRRQAPPARRQAAAV